MAFFIFLMVYLDKNKLLILKSNEEIFIIRGLCLKISLY